MTTKKHIFRLAVLFAPLFWLQCTSIHRSTSQKNLHKSVYIDQFKLTYFRQMLLKSYNNSKAILEIISSDHSGFTEPVLTESDYKLIDSLTTADNDKLRVDSTEGYRRAEGAQGKRPLGYILERIEGKWLDSLARKRWKLSELPSS